MDRQDRLTDRLLADLEHEAAAHPFPGSVAHRNECLACLDRAVQLRADLQALKAPDPASPRLARRLEELLGNAAPQRVPPRVIERVRGIFALRVPAWAVATLAAALVVITWVTAQHVYRPAAGVQWPLPDPTRPDSLNPAHRQGSRTVTGVVSSVRDATSNGVEAHVVSMKDASGATFVLFAWGRPTVQTGDAVLTDAIFTMPPEGGGQRVYQGIATNFRRAR